MLARRITGLVPTRRRALILSGRDDEGNPPEKPWLWRRVGWAAGVSTGKLLVVEAEEAKNFLK